METRPALADLCPLCHVGHGHPFSVGYDHGIKVLKLRCHECGAAWVITEPPVVDGTHEHISR